MVVTTGKVVLIQWGRRLTVPTLPANWTLPFTPLPLRQTSRTTVRVYLQYMLREIRCYFSVARPKSGGYGTPPLQKWGYAYPPYPCKLRLCPRDELQGIRGPGSIGPDHECMKTSTLPLKFNFPNVIENSSDLRNLLLFGTSLIPEVKFFIALWTLRIDFAYSQLCRGWTMIELLNISSELFFCYWILTVIVINAEFNQSSSCSGALLELSAINIQ